MLLAIDIGNTDVVFGIYHKNSWQHVFRISSALSNNYADYEVKLRLLFLENTLHLEDIESIVLSSVVPKQTFVLQQMAQHMFGREALLIAADLYHKLPIQILRPQEIGSDLVCNAMYAYSKGHEYATVVDFGTALTTLTIKGGSTGKILGVSIAPGLKTAIKALFNNTAQLPEVPLQLPSSALGQNTVHAIQAGIMWGYVGMVKELLLQITTEIEAKPYIIATGGLSGQLKEALPMVNEFNKNATLDGMRLIYEAAIKNSK